MLQTVEISLPELLERVRLGQIPMSARAQVTYDVPAPPEATPTLPVPEAREDAMTPEERAEEERIYAEIEKNGIPRVQI